jgi:hypothetical protein
MRFLLTRTSSVAPWTQPCVLHGPSTMAQASAGCSATHEFWLWTLATPHTTIGLVPARQGHSRANSHASSYSSGLIWLGAARDLQHIRLLEGGAALFFSLTFL